MLKKIIIKNYQVHRHLELELSPGLNIIAGESQTGKSSIFRAVRWVVQNRPSGMRFKNWDSEENNTVLVRLDFDDGYVIREIGNDLNIYDLNGEIFDKFKTSVPEEVARFCRLDEFSLRAQHQKYFLLDDSPGERSRKLNELAGLNDIDISIKKIKSIEEKAKAEKEKLEKDIKQLNSDLEALSHLDRVESILEDITGKYEQISTMEDQNERLKKLLRVNLPLIEELNNLKDWLTIEKPFTILKRKIEAIDELKSENRTITNITEGLDEARSELAGLEKLLKVEQHVIRFRSLISEIQSLISQNDRLSSILSDIKSNRVRLNRIEDEIEELNKEKEKIVSSGGICPTCNKELTKDELKNVLGVGL